MDRLLTRAHGLFAAGGAGGGGQVFAADDGDNSAPAAPAGGSGLGTGVGVAGGVYEQSRAGVSGLDVESGQVAGVGGGVAGQGQAGAGVIRDQARTVAAATAPLGNSAAGVRLIVATMDQHLAAMQRELDTTTEQNKVLAVRLRQLAEAYQGAGRAGLGAGMPMSGMGGLPLGGGMGGGAVSGLSNLAALPASLHEPAGRWSLRAVECCRTWARCRRCCRDQSGRDPVVGGLFCGQRCVAGWTGRSEPLCGGGLGSDGYIGSAGPGELDGGNDHDRRARVEISIRRDQLGGQQCSRAASGRRRPAALQPRALAGGARHVRPIPPAGNVEPHLGSRRQCVCSDELPDVALRGGP